MGYTHDQKSIPYSYDDIYRTRKNLFTCNADEWSSPWKKHLCVLSTNGRGHVRAAHSHHSGGVRDVGGRIIEHMMEL